ncbi:acetate--CoA ligase family protein [Streptomyces sp. NPDC018833]|uniref:acetate--CoA ligase family protein n=1 Tax=Streptomyces sp. NPDC018833 TaxID=3365053 RepID=UPI00378946D6
MAGTSLRFGPRTERCQQRRGARGCRSFPGRSSEGWLARPGDGLGVARPLCVPGVPWAWAPDETEAVQAAERLAGADGGVVMKAYWPGLAHKSAVGAVALDLRGPEQVRCAYRDLSRRFGDRMTGVVIQPLAGRGTELFAGVVQDAVFGPLVLFGLGGTATEVLADHSARLAPLTDVEVQELM